MVKTIVITRDMIPSYSSAKRIWYSSSMSDRQLLNNLKKAIAVVTAYRHHLLPDDYYYGVLDVSASGSVLKDPYLISDIEYYLDELLKEFHRRGLDEKYEFEVRFYS